MLTVLNTMPPEIFDAVGVVGFAMYVMNYTLLTFKKLSSESVYYFIINWLAASFVLISLFTSFNLASAMIQVFWIAISTIAIFIRLRGRSQDQQLLA